MGKPLLNKKSGEKLLFGYFIVIHYSINRGLFQFILSNRLREKIVQLKEILIICLLCINVDAAKAILGGKILMKGCVI